METPENNSKSRGTKNTGNLRVFELVMLRFYVQQKNISQEMYALKLKSFPQFCRGAGREKLAIK